MTFGLGELNDVRAINVFAECIDTIELDIKSESNQFHVMIPAFGSHLAALAPAAVIVGRLLGLTDEDICRGFMSYSPVEGRSVVSKPNGLTIIDDCYNANPNSVKAALTSISALSGRRVAILGDMFNLGEHSEQMHFDVGKFAAQSGIDLLICQGELARMIYEGFLSAGGKDVYYYPLMDELMSEIPGKIKKGDTVLVKASRGMHFEKLLPLLTEL